MRDKEVLQAARQIVEAGWHQLDNTDGHGNFCLRAAIGLASGAMIQRDGRVMFRRSTDIDERAAQVRALAADVDAKKLVESFLPERFYSIPLFNDDAATTKEDVLAILDKAIASC